VDPVSIPPPTKQIKIIQLVSTLHTTSSQPAVSSPVLAWWQVLTMSSASVFMLLPAGDCPTTDSLLQMSFFVTDRGENTVLMLLHPIVSSKHAYLSVVFQQRVYVPQYDQKSVLPKSRLHDYARNYLLFFGNCLPESHVYLWYLYSEMSTFSFYRKGRPFKLNLFHVYGMFSCYATGEMNAIQASTWFHDGSDIVISVNESELQGVWYSCQYVRL
jgi:hypothetical protein